MRLGKLIIQQDSAGSSRIIEDRSFTADMNRLITSIHLSLKTERTQVQHSILPRLQGLASSSGYRSPLVFRIPSRLVFRISSRLVFKTSPHLQDSVSSLLCFIYSFSFGCRLVDHEGFFIFPRDKLSTCV